MAPNSFLTRVLQKFYRAYQKLYAEHPPATYDCGAHFIFSRKHFSLRQVKPPAFTPPPSRKLSCFWIDQLSEGVIWQIGDDVAGKPRGKRTLARAEMTRAGIADAGLKVEDDPKPHPRHFNLCGWPTEKDEIKAVAIELCIRATLHVRP